MRIDLRALVQEQVEKLGSKQAVANVLGVSRTAISLYLSGKYAAAGGRQDRLEAKIMAQFCDRILCPHLGRDISQSDCENYCLAPMPQSDPASLRHWIACRHCPHTYEQSSQKEATAC